MSEVAVPLEVLRDRVEQQEIELESAVRELCVAAKTSFTPAHWIRERPLICLSGALAIGWWLGSERRSKGRRGWR